MNKTTTKGYVGGGGGYTEVVAFVHTLRNSYKKKSTQVARASPNELCSNKKNFELYTLMQ